MQGAPEWHVEKMTALAVGKRTAVSTKFNVHMPVVPAYSLGPHSFGTTNKFLSVTALFRGCPVAALIDSACDGLLISQACLDRLGLKSYPNSKPVEMEVADG